MSRVDFSFIDSSAFGPEDKFALFIEEIGQALESSFCERVRPVSLDSRRGLLWFSNHIRQLRERLHMLTDLHRQFPQLVSKQDLSDHRRLYRESILSSKKAANTHYIQNANNTQSAMWNVIRSNNALTRVGVDGRLRADEFNEYFTGIAEKVVSSIPIVTARVDRPTTDTAKFSFRAVTFIEMRDIITGLKNSNSRDAYSMNARLLKCIIDLVNVPLCKLINLCLSANVFPDCLKIARVIPIHKKGITNDIANYRPISVVPIFSKVFEVALKGQMYSHLENSDLLHSAQFGFRQGMSTTTALTELVGFVQQCFEKRLYAHASFYDVTKAFDCVSHDLLCRKLLRLGFDEDSVSLLRSYLTGRLQFVEYDNVTSSRLPLAHGVAQGSVIGPILFLVFINDIGYLSSVTGKIVLFADDTSSLEGSADLDGLALQVRQSREVIAQWFAANRLSINDAKTQSLFFSLRQLSIEQCGSVRYLGIYLDSKLTWEEHVNHLVKRLNTSIYLIRNLLTVVSIDTVFTAYYGCFYSQMAYAVLCWGHSAHASMVFRAQRRCIRVMTGLGFSDCCREKFKEHNFLTFPSVYILDCLLHVKKNMHLYDKNMDSHQYNTRNKDNLLPAFNRTERARDGVNYYAVKLFNKLPSPVQCLSIPAYRTAVKKHLLYNAFYSLDEYFSVDWDNVS